MKNLIAFMLCLFCLAPSAHAQKQKWSEYLTATGIYMQHKMWNPYSGNFVTRADHPESPYSDSWGITIVLDAYAFMVQQGLMTPDSLRNYFIASTNLYPKTKGNAGARILAYMGDQIYVGGDDDLQWCAALVHCYIVTKDSAYLTTAESSFQGLLDLGFWMNDKWHGWMWNSRVRQPDGVSTAYGALTAARLYEVTGEDVYKKWTIASLDALRTPQVGVFPRDLMVAADAALTAYEASRDPSLHARAMELLDSALSGGLAMLHHKEPGFRNPTDIGDLADGLFHFYSVTHKAKYKSLAKKFILYFTYHRSLSDIAEQGFYSQYDTNGKPMMEGTYLGIPDSVPYLSEVAEMLKLFAIANLHT